MGLLLPRLKGLQSRWASLERDFPSPPTFYPAFMTQRTLIAATVTAVLSSALAFPAQAFDQSDVVTGEPAAGVADQIRQPHGRAAGAACTVMENLLARAG